MLSPYRVLDLTDERGIVASTILADLGADVIQIEPPEGSGARRSGPFLAGAPGPEHSLLWQAYARGRRSVVLDIRSEAGRRQLLALVRGADFLIESAAPGELEALGLGHAALSAVEPRLIQVSITPFGTSGPRARYAATDLIVHAASGALALNGDPDRSPLRPGGIRAWTYAGVEAAGAALIAHVERERSGRGQHVEVSALLPTNLAAGFTLLNQAVGQPPARRAGGLLLAAPVRIPLIWPCADGFVSLTLSFLGPTAPFSRRLLEWMHDAGELSSADAERDWLAQLSAAVGDPDARRDVEGLLARLRGFLAARTKRTLLEAAVERSLLLVPVATLRDVLESDQLAARDYWQELPGPVPGSPLRHPGPFARFDRRPIRYARAAPALGAHTAEVLAESRPPRALPAPRPETADAPPLEGVKVLDFMWVMAGPYSTRVLADYGATVVKIESASRLDLVRVLPPFYGGAMGVENSAAFTSINAGKRSLAIDLRQSEAREVILDLVRWCDVVADSFAPGAMQRLGLDPATLRAIKPDLIVLSSCLFGQTGPLASMAGYGTMGAAISGLVQPTGWPDRPPSGPAGPYTDWLAPRFSVPALLAALDHRRRTGEGQTIDQSQAESSLHFLAPHLLACGSGDAGLDRVANADPGMAPHGVFRAAGEDEWLALACRDDDDFVRLCAAIGQPNLANDARFQTLDGRLEHSATLERLIEEWTRKRDPAEGERSLQAQGVPAHAVIHTARAAGVPELVGHVLEAEHALHGRVKLESTRARLSRTGARVERAGPVLGQDTDPVLRDLLGYSAARIAELRSHGVVSGPD